MRIGTALVISLLSVIALVAEIFLYFTFGMGAAMSGQADSVMGVALFFVGLMILTAALGVLAPLCALVEMKVNRKNLGTYILMSILGVIAAVYIGFMIFGYSAMQASVAPH